MTSVPLLLTAAVLNVSLLYNTPASWLLLQPTALQERLVVPRDLNNYKLVSNLWKIVETVVQLG